MIRVTCSVGLTPIRVTCQCDQSDLFCRSDSDQSDMSVCHLRALCWRMMSERRRLQARHFRSSDFQVQYVEDELTDNRLPSTIDADEVLANRLVELAFSSHLLNSRRRRSYHMKALTIHTQRLCMRIQSLRACMRADGLADAQLLCRLCGLTVEVGDD